MGRPDESLGRLPRTRAAGAVSTARTWPELGSGTAVAAGSEDQRVPPGPASRPAEAKWASTPWSFRALVGLGRLAERAGLAGPVFRGVFPLLRWRMDLDARRAWSAHPPTARDVLVCTYPKSGTNWMLQLVVQLVHDGRLDFRHIHDVVPWPDALNPTHTVGLDVPPPPSPSGLRVIKTHGDRPEVCFTPDARYIVVIRDPKDALASGFHFGPGVLRRFVDVSWTPEAWVRDLEGGASMLGSWARHTDAWWRLRDAPNVLVVTFEAMKADLPGIVRCVGRFLDLPTPDDLVARVVARCGFAYMRDHEACFAPVEPAVRPSDVRMVRSGKTGAAGTLFTEDQLARIDRWCRAELRQLDSSFPYESWYGDAGDTDVGA